MMDWWSLQGNLSSQSLHILCILVLYAFEHPLRAAAGVVKEAITMATLGLCGGGGNGHHGEFFFWDKIGMVIASFTCGEGGKDDPTRKDDGDPTRKVDGSNGPPGDG